MYNRFVWGAQFYGNLLYLLQEKGKRIIDLDPAAPGFDAFLAYILGWLARSAEDFLEEGDGALDREGVDTIMSWAFLSMDSPVEIGAANFMLRL